MLKDTVRRNADIEYHTQFCLSFLGFQSMFPNSRGSYEMLGLRDFSIQVKSCNLVCLDFRMLTGMY